MTNMKKIKFKEVQIGEIYNLCEHGCSYKKNSALTGIIQNKIRDESYTVRPDKEVFVQKPCPKHMRIACFKDVPINGVFWVWEGSRCFIKESLSLGRHHKTVQRFGSHTSVYVLTSSDEESLLPAPKKPKEKPVVTVAFKGFQFREGMVGGETIENIETLIKSLQTKRRLYKRFALQHGWES